MRQMLRSLLSRRVPAAAILLLSLGGVAAIAAPAGAEVPITEFAAVPSVTQAGGHPDLLVKFAIKNRLEQQSQSACNCEDAKDATVHLPPGFIGNPHATPQCSIADFSADVCPIDSQVGIANVVTAFLPFNSAVYNITPPPGVAGLLGFKIFLFDTPQFTVLSARTGSDYGLDATATSIYHGLSVPLKIFTQDLWGVPAAPVHNLLRLNSAFNPQAPGATFYADSLCSATGSESTTDPNSIRKPCSYKIPPASSNSPETPFLQNPTNCDAPLTSTLDVLGYDGSEQSDPDGWPQMTGCDQLSFNPSLYAQPTTTDTDTASGIDVNLSIPQEQSPSIPSPTELRAATVTLPPGFSINPNAADGKSSCSDQEARFGTTEEAQCPEFSKVGSLTIDSSALPGPLPGYVYLGEPKPGNRYRIFLVADGFAVHIKLAGMVHADPETGQVVVTFNELPQSPLTAFNMHFFGAERALLATPTRCGTYPVTTTFTPWDSSIGSQTSQQYFTLDSGPGGSPCPSGQRPFNPSFEAATANPTAGAHSPFSLEIRRSDGDQNLTGLTVATPPGFAATLAGIPYCPEADLAQLAGSSYSGLAELENPLCPAASQVGTAVAGAGAGNHPVYVRGAVYLAGPYKGAPLSLAIVTPAVSGPYDLGNVVVRAAVHVDPTDAQITAVSDPLPRILEGIPLRLRTIRVNLDRPGFTLNPTNCDPSRIGAAIIGDEGGSANLREPFQVSNCGTLPFEPKLAVSFAGGMKRAQDPALTATLSAKAGEAGIAKTVVTLPQSEQIDNAHIGDVCTNVQFAAAKCPASSVIGSAKAVTPLLAKPLEGPVYLRSAPENKSGLPDVVAALNGQIDIVLDGKIDTVNERVRTTFSNVPDAPVSKFVLHLDGGDKGLLLNDQNLCANTKHALEAIVGQNGRSANANPQIALPCHKAAKKKRHSKHGTRG